MTLQEGLSGIYEKFRAVHSYLLQNVMRSYDAGSIHLACTNAQDTCIPMATA